MAALISVEVSKIQQDIRNYSQLDPATALRNGTIASLKETTESLFSDSGFDWPEIQQALLSAALPIVVKAVNQRTGAASLDYAAHRDNGLRVIAVGGNSLSRGLTLEGLSTSYFYRNSQMYDTLLQMGRWFGYRDGYADLCRLWLAEEAIQWYSHITSATEELRSEVQKMRRKNATPKEFGLKVRAHPDSLIVTAQNKMRLAHTIERVISISEQGLESTRLKTSKNVISANKKAVVNFLEKLQAEGIQPTRSPWGNPFWPGIRKQHIADLLRNFEVHPLNVAFQTDDLAEYFESTTEPSLQLWDVVMAGGSEAAINFAGVSVTPAKRAVVIRENGILVSGSKMRVGSRGIEREGVPTDVVDQIVSRAKMQKRQVSDKEFREVRPRPLLLIHVIAPYTTDGDNKPVRFDTGDDELVALGLSMPSFDDSAIAQRVKYRVNLVEWRAMLEESVDDDLEEDEDVAS